MKPTVIPIETYEEIIQRGKNIEAMRAKQEKGELVTGTIEQITDALS